MKKGKPAKKVSSRNLKVTLQSMAADNPFHVGTIYCILSSMHKLLHFQSLYSTVNQILHFRESDLLDVG